MEIARLVLDFCKVLVWPAVTLVIAHRFRGEIRGLLRRIRNLSAAAVDAEFSDAVEEAGAGAGAAVRHTPPLDGEVQTNGEESSRPAAAVQPGGSPLAAVAFVSPKGTIMAAWRLVETKLVDMVPGYENPGRRGTAQTRSIVAERPRYIGDREAWEKGQP